MADFGIERNECALHVWEELEVFSAKPILDRSITEQSDLYDALKLGLISVDSTMRSNLSVGMPIDLLCYERDSLHVTKVRRFDDRDDYMRGLRMQWGEGLRRAFTNLPNFEWSQ